MNWVQYSDNQDPINLDNIVTFEKEVMREEGGPYELKFYSVSGKVFYWKYRKASDRNKDYQLLLQRVQGVHILDCYKPIIADSCK